MHSTAVDRHGQELIIFAGQADRRSNNCTRHALLRGKTLTKVTRGQTAPQLTERHCSWCAVLLRLTNFRSEAVTLTIAYFQVEKPSRTLLLS